MDHDHAVDLPTPHRYDHLRQLLAALAWEQGIYRDQLVAAVVAGSDDATALGALPGGGPYESVDVIITTLTTAPRQTAERVLPPTGGDEPEHPTVDDLTPADPNKYDPTTSDVPAKDLSPHELEPASDEDAQTTADEAGATPKDFPSEDDAAKTGDATRIERDEDDLPSNVAAATAGTLAAQAREFFARFEDVADHIEDIIDEAAKGGLTSALGRVVGEDRAKELVAKLDALEDRLEDAIEHGVEARLETATTAARQAADVTRHQASDLATTAKHAATQAADQAQSFGREAISFGRDAGEFAVASTTESRGQRLLLAAALIGTASGFNRWAIRRATGIDLPFLGPSRVRPVILGSGLATLAALTNPESAE